MRPTERVTRRLNSVGNILALVFGVGVGLLWVAEQLGNTGQELVAPLGFLLALVGGTLLVLWGAVSIAVRALRRTAIEVGAIVPEAEPPPPGEPTGKGPAWRIAAGSRVAIAYLEEIADRPRWLACDGRWIEIRWPFNPYHYLVLRSRSKAFELLGCRAYLTTFTGLLRMGGRRPYWGTGDVPIAYDLAVQGASVEPLDESGPRSAG